MREADRCNCFKRMIKMQQKKADGMRRFSMHISESLLDGVMKTERLKGKSASDVLNELLRERLNQHQQSDETICEATEQEARLQASTATALLTESAFWGLQLLS